MFDSDKIADELCELIRIDSLSGQERRLAELLSARLKEIGLPTRFDDAHLAIDGEVGNLYARIDATAPDMPALMLNAHMDTVKPGCGIEPVRDGDLLCSAGDTILGGDDQAGIAVLMAVVRELVRQRPPHGEIHVIFTVAEETGLNGAKNLDYDSFQADYALALDGGREPGSVCTAAPSAQRLAYDIYGKAAHSGVCPEQGISAVQAAAAAIAAMKLGRIDEETTANIGLISGGEARNIIPPHCRMEGEARSHDRGKLDAQVAHMGDCVRSACEQIGARYEVEQLNSYHCFALGEDHPLVQAAMEAARQLGLEPKLERGGGGSDANVFNEHGIPAIILPTGTADPHTLDESVSIPMLGKCAQYLWTVIRCLSR
jgi:tripeptide aminopeptidase